MKSVLIISYYYHQRDFVASNRIKGLVKYLPLYGWNPIILTIKTDDNSQLLNENIADTGFYDKTWLLKWMFKTNDYNEIRNKIERKFQEKNGFFDIKRIIQYIITIGRDLFIFPDESTGWIKPGVKEGILLYKRCKYKIVISSFSPSASHIIARKIKKETNVPWIADFRDLWTQNHNYERIVIREIQEKQLEQSTLFNADALVSVSKPSAEKLQKFHHRDQVYVIPNGFDPDNLNDGYPIDSFFRIVYTGNIYREKQNPEPLFKVTKELFDERKINPNNVKIEFFGYTENWLQDLANNYGLNKNVTLHQRIKPEAAIIEQRKSQLLLLLTWNDPTEKGIYTGKIFDYLAARRPILSIGTTDGDVIADLLNQTGSGVYISKEIELKNYLLTAYNEYQKFGFVQYRGIDREVMKYSHKEMARKFAEVLDEIIKEK
jgi:hypothetical protein